MIATMKYVGGTPPEGYDYTELGAPPKKDPTPYKDRHIKEWALKLWDKEDQAEVVAAFTVRSVKDYDSSLDPLGSFTDEEIEVAMGDLRKESKRWKRMKDIGFLDMMTFREREERFVIMHMCRGMRKALKYSLKLWAEEAEIQEDGFRIRISVEG